MRHRQEIEANSGEILRKSINSRSRVIRLRLPGNLVPEPAEKFKAELLRSVSPFLGALEVNHEFGAGSGMSCSRKRVSMMSFLDSDFHGNDNPTYGHLVISLENGYRVQ